MMNEDDSETPWVSASEIGRATYFPYALYLSAHGETMHADNQRQVEQGLTGHAHWEDRPRLQPRLLRQIAVGSFLLMVVILLFVDVGGS